jgi:hypothetical protein
VSDGLQPGPVEPSPEVPSEPLPLASTEPSATLEEPVRYHFVRWWTFLSVLLAVWIPASAIGISLFYWWIHSMDKTWPVFVVLVFVIGCTVAALLFAMAGQRPLIAALAIAVLTAPFAATAGAAPMHGTYYCSSPLKPRCFVGLIPY